MVKLVVFVFIVLVFVIPAALWLAGYIGFGGGKFYEEAPIARPAVGPAAAHRPSH